MSVEQNEQVRAFLDAVCLKVGAREMHREIRDELAGHVGELVEEYVTDGVPEDDAVRRAIARMGDPGDLGRQLHQAHRPRTEWGLLSIIGLLLGLQLLTMYTLDASGLLGSYGQTSMLSKDILFVGLGAVVALGLFGCDYRRLRAFSVILFAAVLLLVLFTSLTGQSVNGRPFLVLGAVSFNVVDASPVLFIVALAGIFANWDWKRPWAFWYALGLFLVPCFLYLGCPSMSAVLVYAGAFLGLAIVSGARLVQILGIFAPALFGLVLAVVMAPYRLARVAAFLNPAADPQGSGWLYLQLREMLHSAAWWGGGTAPPSYPLPEMHTDFVFAYIVHAFGWLAGLAVLALGVTFVVRAAYLLLRLRDQHGRLLVAGLVTAFGVQFLLNVLMILGLAPVTGMCLPFLSYGGTQIILHMAAVGLVLGVFRRRDMFRTAQGAERDA